MGTVRYVTGAGTTIDTLDSFHMAPNGFQNHRTVYDGAVVEGNLILEVPKNNWKGGVLAVSPAMSSKDVFVSLE